MVDKKDNSALVLKYRRQYDQVKSEKRALEGKVERLEQAKRDLAALIDGFSDYERKIKDSVDRFPDTRFKGDWRIKYGERMSQLSQEVGRQKDRHDENLRNIEAEVQSLTAKENGCVTQMRYIQGTIDRLLG